MGGGWGLGCRTQESGAAVLSPGPAFRSGACSAGGGGGRKSAHVEPG